jgi:hypothetical protein
MAGASDQLGQAQLRLLSWKLKQMETRHCFGDKVPLEW